jgi:hypothetical protein
MDHGRSNLVRVTHRASLPVLGYVASTLEPVPSGLGPGRNAVTRNTVYTCPTSRIESEPETRTLPVKSTLETRNPDPDPKPGPYR